MGKSLEHFMLQGLVFFIRGLGGRGGLVGGPLEEGGFSDGSDGSDGSDWSEILTKHGGCHKKIPRLWGEVRDGLIF